MNNLKMEFLLLVRNRSIILLCFAYLLIGILALGFGVQRYYSEQNQIAELEARYQQDIADWKKKAGSEPIDSYRAGYAAYYLFNPVALTPSPWSALFSGERKENYVLQRVRLLAVNGQIHGSPIKNSEHSALGTLDVQFVWLYLMPLLIGLISVTCIADDRRLGRWPLVNALTSIKTLVARRLLIRFLLVSLLNLAIILLSLLLLPIGLLPIEIGSNLFWVIGALACYQLFWFLIAAVIIVSYLNAKQSILMLVGVWLITAWFIPAIHFNGSLNPDTYNAGIELLVNQRQDMNDSWDRDKQADFQQFLQQYPEWKDTTPLGNDFDWKWYYAMQKRSDDKVSELADQYLLSHSDGIWQWLSPTLMTQYFLEDIADTGSIDYQDWIEDVVEWHSRTQEFWFPYFYFDKQFDREHIGSVPEFLFNAETHSSVRFLLYWGLLFLLCFCLLTLSYQMTSAKVTSTSDCD